MIQPFAESGSKSLQESFASVGGVAYVASGTGICRTVAGSGLTRVESRSRWNIPGKCNRLCVIRGSVGLFRRGRLLVQRRGPPWHHAAGTGPNRPVAVAGVELARGRTGGTRFRRARDR